MKICGNFVENGKNDGYSIDISHIAKTANPSSDEKFIENEERIAKSDWVDENAHGLTETKAAINEIYPKFLSNETFAHTDRVAVEDQRKFSSVVEKCEDSNSFQKISPFLGDKFVLSLPEIRKDALVIIDETEDNKSSHDGIEDFEFFSIDRFTLVLKKATTSLFELLVLILKVATVGIWSIAWIGFLLYISYLVANCTLWDTEIGKYLLDFFFPYSKLKLAICYMLLILLSYFISNEFSLRNALTDIATCYKDCKNVFVC